MKIAAKLKSRMTGHRRPVRSGPAPLLLAVTLALTACETLTTMPDLSFIGLGGDADNAGAPPAAPEIAKDGSAAGAADTGQQEPFRPAEDVMQMGQARILPKPKPVIADAGDAALVRYVADHGRLLDAAFLLMSSATHLCPDRVTGETGLVVGDRLAFPPALRPAAERLVDFGGRLTVIARASHSPADRGGFVIGDRVLRIAGRDLPPGERAWTFYPALLERRFDPETGIAVYEVERGPRTLRLPLGVVQACPYRVLVSPDTAINGAVVDGQVVMTQGLIQYLADPIALHAVTAYFLALTWPASDPRQADPSFVGDALSWLPDLTGGTAPPALVERVDMAEYDRLKAPEGLTSPHADVLSVYLMTAAGLDYREVPAIWRALSADERLRAGGQLAASYPLGDDRLARLAQAVATADRQKAAGRPLIPPTPAGPSSQAPASPGRSPPAPAAPVPSR